MNPENDALIGKDTDRSFCQTAACLAALLGRCTRLPRGLPMVELGFDCCPILDEVLRVSAFAPAAKASDDRRCGAQQYEAGAERKPPDHIGRHHGHPADRALRGTGAVIADGGGIGDLVTLTDQGAEVLEVFRVRSPTKDDLHDRGIPDRGRRVL